MCQQHPAHDGCHCRCCLFNSLCTCCCCCFPYRGVMGISFDHKESRWLLPVKSYQVTCMACITSNMSCIAQGVSTCAAAPVVSLGDRASCPARCCCHCEVTCGGGLRAPHNPARSLTQPSPTSTAWTPSQSLCLPPLPCLLSLARDSCQAAKDALDDMEGLQVSWQGLPDLVFNVLKAAQASTNDIERCVQAGQLTHLPQHFACKPQACGT